MTENMRLKNLGHQLRSIKTDNRGNAEWVVGLFSFLFLLVLMIYTMQLARYRNVSDLLEDSLAASGLASAIIDVERYGIDHVKVISEPESAFSVYVSTLKTNLQLEDDFTSRMSWIDGKINIDEYCIYNVYEDYVEEVVVDGYGIKNIRKGAMGDLCAPNGQVIKATGVYSEISFHTKDYWNKSQIARKGKLIEVRSINE